jgi:hypothetical protein
MLSSLRYGVLLSFFALLALLVPQTSRAAIGTLDDVPGATLLIPYFEVDLADANGRDTLITVQNSSATALLAHTVVWSDEGVASAIFNIYLTGFDIQAFSMRDVLNGNLPQTASDGQDTTDTISPQGLYSQDINFASCTGQLPPAAGVIPGPAGMTPADLQLALTGAPTATVAPGMCWGRNLGDGHARGYVTIDMVNQCTLLKPGDPGYADVPNNILWSGNALLGSFLVVNPSTHEWFGDNALGLESVYYNNGSDPRLTTPGNYTFYGRYNGWNAGDRLEPLPTAWVGQGETESSDLIVWRDSKTDGAPHACGSSPAYYPLGQEGLAWFGTDSQRGTPASGGVLPALTQRTPVSAVGSGSGKLGEFFAILSTTVAAAGNNPPADPAAAQSYVGVVRSRLGEAPTAGGHRAVSLDNAQQAQHYVPGT